jgi:SAM-dependent methyltransferase
MAFTAHNIRFADGSETMPGALHLLADVPWCQGAKRVLALLYGADVKGRRIADLGCLEGGYALEFARLGLDAFGIEVRQSNFDNCMEVKRRAGLSNLDFARDDVWNLARYGRFDVIFCCGLLYHLDRPRAYLKLMGEQARDAVIVNTHYAPWDWYPTSAFQLSPIETHEGLPGRWFVEHNAQSDAEKEQLKWASWDNKSSFWPVKEALLQAIHEAGFDLVFEQTDTLGDILANGTAPETVRNHRGVFVGIRSHAIARKERTWLQRLVGA